MKTRELPIECPKCGDKSNDWQGPYYKHAFRVGEFLKYYCPQCGYGTSLPCLDAK
jgi:ribosomal protein S27AE